MKNDKTRNTIMISFLFCANCATTPVINLNTTSQEIFETLPGVDEATSFRIVHGRQHHPYRAIDDLIAVGISPILVARLRPSLTISKPTAWKIPPKTVSVLVTESSPPAAPESTEHTR